MSRHAGAAAHRRTQRLTSASSGEGVTSRRLARKACLWRRPSASALGRKHRSAAWRHRRQTTWPQADAATLLTKSLPKEILESDFLTRVHSWSFRSSRFLTKPRRSTPGPGSQCPGSSAGYRPQGKPLQGSQWIGPLN